MQQQLLGLQLLPKIIYINPFRLLAVQNLQVVIIGTCFGILRFPLVLLLHPLEILVYVLPFLFAPLGTAFVAKALHGRRYVLPKWPLGHTITAIIVPLRLHIKLSPQPYQSLHFILRPPRTTHMHEIPNTQIIPTLSLIHITHITITTTTTSISRSIDIPTLLLHVPVPVVLTLNFLQQLHHAFSLGELS
ncbi:hypothetical protein V8G54_008208 [Vigna mungo]|uniref:Uncharacterized protein n=1 Tax=Vigna mungo TaxID=3915 RepID=A0AAQ3P4T2_VIGMU